MSGKPHGEHIWSALPLKADIRAGGPNFCWGPEADVDPHLKTRQIKNIDQRNYRIPGGNSECDGILAQGCSEHTYAKHGFFDDGDNHGRIANRGVKCPHR